MASLAYRFAIQNLHIRTDVMDIAEFPQVAMQYNVMGVPFTVVNGTHGVRGYTRDEAYCQQVVEVALRTFEHMDREPTARDRATEVERQTAERLRSLGLVPGHTPQE